MLTKVQKVRGAASSLVPCIVNAKFSHDDRCLFGHKAYRLVTGAMLDA